MVIGCYLTPSVSCGHFLCFVVRVLCDVVSVALLLVVIVWLNSDFFSVLICLDVCEVAYMVTWFVVFTGE